MPRKRQPTEINAGAESHHGPIDPEAIASCVARLKKELVLLERVAGLSGKSKERQAQVFSVPKWTEWGNLCIERIKVDALRISVKNVDGKVVDAVTRIPSSMGMLDGRDGQCTDSWVLLTTFVSEKGLVTVGTAPRSRQKPRNIKQHKTGTFGDEHDIRERKLSTSPLDILGKRVSALSAALKAVMPGLKGSAFRRSHARDGYFSNFEVLDSWSEKFQEEQQWDERRRRV